MHDVATVVSQHERCWKRSTSTASWQSWYMLQVLRARRPAHTKPSKVTSRASSAERRCVDAWLNVLVLVDNGQAMYLQVLLRGSPPELEYLFKEGVHVVMVDSHVLPLADVRGKLTLQF